MKALVWGVGLFAAAMFMHIIIWRIRLPPRPIKLLLSMFVSVFLAGGAVLLLWGNAGIPDFSYVFLLYFSLFASYLATYPAMEAQSPSLLIMGRISRAGKDGLSREGFSRSLNDSVLVESRMKELVDSGLAELSGSRYRITGKGEVFVSVFILFRDLLGLDKGG